MVDKELLSRDELDALLTEVDDGNVDVKPQLDVDYSPYDLTSQEHVSRGRLPALDLINERFARAFRSSASDVLRKPAEIVINGVRIVGFSELAEAFYVPSSFSLIRLNPLRGMGMVVLEPALVFRVVDTFFGGVGREFDAEEGREYTSTEVRIINIIAEAILHDLRAAWAPVQHVELSVAGHESNVQMTQICGPNDLAVVCSFTVNAEGGGGDFQIVMPYASLEPIKSKLESTSASDEEKDERWAIQVREEVMNVRATMVASLMPLQLTMRRLLQMAPGDILPIDEPEKIDIFLEGVRTMRGRLGRSRANLAVQVDEFLDLQEASESSPPRTLAAPVATPPHSESQSAS